MVSFGCSSRAVGKASEKKEAAFRIEAESEAWTASHPVTWVF